MAHRGASQDGLIGTDARYRIPADPRLRAANAAFIRRIHLNHSLIRRIHNVQQRDRRHDVRWRGLSKNTEMSSTGGRPHSLGITEAPACGVNEAEQAFTNAMVRNI